jgi:DNA-binding MarR family transcriptional regulator
MGWQAEDLAARLEAAAMRIRRRGRRAGSATGLSSPRLSALAAIARLGPVSLARLAEAEQVSAPTMTRLVEALVRAGLALREPDPANRRRVRITATDAAPAALRGSLAGGDALARRLERVAESEMRALQRGVEILERVLR